VTISEIEDDATDATEVSDIDIAVVEQARRKGRGKAKRVADGVARRTSARLAKLEGASYVSMATKAVHLRGLRDALKGCSPKLQAKVLKGKMPDAICSPLSSRSVEDLHGSVTPCIVPVANGLDV
jgi:hypothetical protein